MVDVYEQFTEQDNSSLDFSDEALLEMYIYESTGNGNVDSRHDEYLKTGRKVNGYAVGKKWMDVTFAMWKKEVDYYGWCFAIYQLMCFYDKIPGWMVKLALDKHIKKTWLGYQDNNYTEHLKLIDSLECGE